MVLRDWVRFCAVDVRFWTAAVKRFWIAPKVLWKELTEASAASTDSIELFAPATVSTFWFANVVAPKGIALAPAVKPISAAPAPVSAMFCAADRVIVPRV